VFADQSWENGRQEQIKDEIFAVVKNLRAFHGSQNGATGTFTVLTPNMITENVIPGDMVRRPPNAGACTNSGNLCADHPWGDAGVVTSQTGSFGLCAWTQGTSSSCNQGGANSPYFAIELRDMPASACLKTALNNSGANTPPGFYDVVINGTSMLGLGKGLPPRVTDAANNCNNGTSNVLDFVYRVVPPQS
jgi:hypothetical protein